MYSWAETDEIYPIAHNHDFCSKVARVCPISI